MVGPREVIFMILAEFVEGVEKDTGCQLVPGKCKFYSPDASAWEDIQRRDIIPIYLKHI